MVAHLKTVGFTPSKMLTLPYYDTPKDGYLRKLKVACFNQARSFQYACLSLVLSAELLTLLNFRTKTIGSIHFPDSHPE